MDKDKDKEKEINRTELKTDDLENISGGNVLAEITEEIERKFQE